MNWISESRVWPKPLNFFPLPAFRLWLSYQNIANHMLKEKMKKETSFAISDTPLMLTDTSCPSLMTYSIESTSGNRGCIMLRYVLLIVSNYCDRE